ncbi:MAG: polymer-forming cytoskeletal protein [Victivallales bacterium]|nr:polymer-forming cytoskeletal protein [Victivallales bacterium]MCF7888881.1 polymer-forming cytoskeletal protein [Victivallales bacterium]
MKKFFKKDDDSDSLNYGDNNNKENNSAKELNMDKSKVTALTMDKSNATTLTPDIEINGSIKFNNVLEVNCKFEGELITKDGEIIVGKTGSVKADFKVKNAIIEGKVEGNVTATEKIELKEKAQLIGDLTAKTLSIEEGVYFVGKCNVNPGGIKAGTPVPKNNKKD